MSALRNIHVLVAEDCADNQRLLRLLLERAGARVEIVGDGAAAVARTLAAERQGQPYCVVVLDMQMPVLDGYAATRQLRQAGYRGSIVALTAHALSIGRQRCLDAGCDEYCPKPIDRVQLLETIARMAARGQRTASAVVCSEPREQAGAAQPCAAPGQAAGAVWDAGALAQDDELVELVRMFIEDLADDVDRMRLALDGGDLEALAELAHRLKGSAGSYGFHEMTRRAGELERQARAGATGPGLDAELVALERLAGAVRPSSG